MTKYDGRKFICMKSETYNGIYNNECSYNTGKFWISRNLLCSSALELHFSVELQVLILVPWFLLNGIRLKQVKLSHQLNVRKKPEMIKGKIKLVSIILEQQVKPLRPLIIRSLVYLGLVFME